MKTLKWIIFIGAVFAGIFVRSEIKRAAIIPEPRHVILVAEQVLKDEYPKANPVQSSRFLAVVATDYYYNFKNNLNYDYSTSSLRVTMDQILQSDNQKIAKGKLPTGTNNFKSASPDSPNADKLSRFILDQDYRYDVAVPPRYGSDKFKDDLIQVTKATYEKSRSDIVSISRWSGVDIEHRLETVWQDKMYEAVRKYKLNDREYAYLQMIIAQTIADAYAETWKIKYTYWTASPKQADERVINYLPETNYPAYVSEHAVVSNAVSRVLSTFFPMDKEYYTELSDDSKLSRIFGGINFQHDILEGEKMGDYIGDYVVHNLTIKAIK